MKVTELEPGKCYIQKIPDGNGTIYEIDRYERDGEHSLLLHYKRWIDFNEDLSQIVVDSTAGTLYTSFYDDNYEPCDVAVLDKLIKLYDIFRASASPLIKQATK